MVGAGGKHWVVSWSASPSPQQEEEQLRNAKLIFDNQTVREIVHLSLGGSTIRVRLSNAYGKEGVEIGAADIALPALGADVIAESNHALTFSGRSGITIPANGTVISDPIQMTVSTGADVAISLFIPKAALGAGVHYSSQQTGYLAPGNMTRAAGLPDAEKFASWVFLNALDVMAPETNSTLVAFGDSITDGAHSTVDANHRWPDFLAQRLAAKGKRLSIGIANAGIGGNRVLHDASSNMRFGVNALARFDRDVLAQPGLKYVIVMEGINDLGHPGSSAPDSETVSAEDLIAGLQQMAERAHENGAKVFGATLTPFAGTVSKGYFTPEKEQKRKTVNEWIRTAKVFDGVIDFEKATRDREHPDQMLPAYDSGDHLHPNDAGYKAMADSIDLSLFR